MDFLRRALESAHDLAREHLQKALVRQKRGYDAHAKQQSPYKPGDLVRYYYPVVAQCNKFARPWIGPFRIVEKTTEVDYKIEPVSGKGRTRVVHFDNLKPFLGDRDDIGDEPDLPPVRDPSASSESEGFDALVDYQHPLDVETDPVGITPERVLRPRRLIRKPKRYRSGALRARMSRARAQAVTGPTRDCGPPVKTLCPDLTMGET